MELTGSRTLRISVGDEIFQALPDYCSMVVIAADFDNSGLRAAVANQLQEAVATALVNRVGAREHTTSLYELLWAAAIEDASAHRARLDSEAILTTAVLRTGCPGLAVNLPAHASAFEIRFATGTEVMLSERTRERETADDPGRVWMDHPAPGELIMIESGTREVFCRMWHANPERRPTDTSRRILIRIDAIGPQSQVRARQGRKAIQSLLGGLCGAKLQFGLLHLRSPLCVLPI